MPAGKHYTLTAWGKIVAKLIAANPYPGGTGPAGPKQQ
jgi:antitoxin (DNA-binding transcriptional repressor) of toxin-antitoxin stability system